MKLINWISFAINVRASFDDAYQGPWNWIKRDGYKLKEDGKDFRFASYNIANLFLIDDGNRQQFDGFTARGIPTPWETENAILAIKGSSGKVARSYTLGFGKGHHVIGIRQYNEAAMVGIDYSLALARKHGIRLIIPFINHHWSKDGDGAWRFGDYNAICKYRNKPASQFYTDATLIQDMLNLIDDILNHDPTVLAWETGNELGGWDEKPPPADWTIKMAMKIKSISPNALVMDGTMGGLHGGTRYQYDVLNSPYVDLFSNHYYYGESDYDRIKKDTKQIAEYSNKVFIIGEFGFKYDVCKKIYQITLDEPKIAGALIWSLRYASRDGGFYVHSEGNDNWSFHVPGFPQSSGFSQDDYRMGKMIREYGLAIDGKPANTPFPAPAGGRAISDSSVNPKQLRWFNSAWASRYMIYRRHAKAVDTVSKWKLLTTQVIDGVKDGSILYKDMNPPTNEFVWYLIQPVSSDDAIDFEEYIQLGPFST